MAKLEEQIAKAEAKLKQLKAEAQRVEARKRAADAQRKRQDETRRKVLVGAVVLAKLEAGEYDAAAFNSMMHQGLTRAEDRALFELPALAEGQPEAGPSAMLGGGGGTGDGGG